MQILTPGVLPTNSVYTHKCANCGCVFTFTRHEARYFVTPKNEGIYVVMCPQSGCFKDGWVKP